MNEEKLKTVKKILAKGYTTPTIQKVGGIDRYMLANGANRTVIIDKEIYEYVKGLDDA